MKGPRPTWESRREVVPGRSGMTALLAPNGRGDLQGDRVGAGDTGVVGPELETDGERERLAETVLEGALGREGGRDVRGPLGRHVVLVVAGRVRGAALHREGPVRHAEAARDAAAEPACLEGGARTDGAHAADADEVECLGTGGDGQGDGARLRSSVHRTVVYSAFCVVASRPGRMTKSSKPTGFHVHPTYPKAPAADGARRGARGGAEVRAASLELGAGAADAEGAHEAEAAVDALQPTVALGVRRAGGDGRLERHRLGDRLSLGQRVRLLEALVARRA